MLSLCRSCSSWGVAIALVAAVACGPDDDARPSGTGLGPTANPTTATTDDPAASSSTTSSVATAADSTIGPPPGDGSSSGTPIDTTGGMATTGGPPGICDSIAGESLVPPSVCDGPSGNTSTEVPPNGLFSTSWFGCYYEDDGSLYMDPFDNCEFACGNQGLCPAGQDGPTCEANLKWFAADADRYGCGGRIRVTNCDNGLAVVLTTLDRGPNCNTVEMACDTPVLDMSHDAMVHLFEGGTYGGCELQTVVVEPVDATTPLGPV